MARFFAVLLLLALTAAPVAGQAPPSGPLNTPAACLRKYGQPDLFLMTFGTQPALPEDYQHRVEPDVPRQRMMFARRYGVWVYIKQGFEVFFTGDYLSRYMLFDPRQAAGLLPGTNLQPGMFTPELSQAQITSRFGPPESVCAVALGSSVLQVFRYPHASGGPKSFSFFDGHLNGVNAGFREGTKIPVGSPGPPVTSVSDLHSILGSWRSSVVGVAVTFKELAGKPGRFGGFWSSKGKQGGVISEGTYSKRTRLLSFTYPWAEPGTREVDQRRARFRLSSDGRMLDGYCQSSDEKYWKQWWLWR
jgi:hypothetical protein